MWRTVLVNVVHIRVMHAIMQQTGNFEQELMVSESTSAQVVERTTDTCVCEDWPGMTFNWNLCGTQGNFKGISRNNLGGFGPNTADQAEIRYQNVASLNGQSLDLVVTNKSTYVPYNISRNVIRSNLNDVGVHGCVGVINVKSNTTVKFNFAFKIHGSEQAVQIGSDDKFIFSVWDLDVGGGSKESVHFDRKGVATLKRHALVDDDSSTVPPLKFLEWDPTAKLKVCEGDCDDDSDCSGAGSRCVQRTNGGYVEGCTRGDSYDSSIKDIKEADYCSNPIGGYPLNFVLWSPPSGSLGVCQGDCDNDKDCPGSSRCVERNTKGYPRDVEGCTAGDSMNLNPTTDTSYPDNYLDVDYCTNPDGIFPTQIVLSKTPGKGSDNPLSYTEWANKSVEVQYKGSSTWDVEFEVRNGTRGRNFLFQGCTPCTTTTTTTTLIRGPVGGSGGGAFDDGLHVNGINSIDVWWGSYVDAIQVHYRVDGSGVKHGGSGGGKNSLTLAADEYIMNVKVRSGSLIDKLEFGTNTNRWGQYGGNGGGESVFSAPTGAMLGSIRGRSGSKLDAISFVFVPLK